MELPSFFYGITDVCRLGPRCKVDWNAWSSIATGAAVFVALGTSFTALRSTKKENEFQRNHAKDQERMRDDATAARLALVLEHELFLVGSQLNFSLRMVTNENIEKAPADAVRTMHAYRRVKAFTIMERSVDHFSSFGPNVGAKLMMVLSGWYALTNGPDLVGIDEAPLELQIAGARSTRRTISMILESINEARAAIRPWASRYRDEFPEIG